MARSTRRFLAGLIGGAALIHAAITPEHFRESLVYGILFLAALTFQAVIAALLVRRRDPPAHVYAAALWGSLGLIALWIVTRAVTSPFGVQPEEVSLAGVLATGVELAALLALVVLVPARRAVRAPVRARAAIAWGVLAGLAYAGLFALASSTVVYRAAALPASVAVPSAALYGGPVSVSSPWIVLVLSRHLYASAALWTLAFLLLSAALLGIAVGLAVAIRGTAPACAPRRSRWLALAPSFLAVPSCCAAPLAGFLGAGALAPLLLATPWVLAATTVFLLIQAIDLARRYRRLRRVRGGP